MKTPLRVILALLGCACAARGQSLSLISSPSTAASEEYSNVTCTSTNAGLNVDVLQLATDTRDVLTPVLQLGREWRFPVHIRVVLADDPLGDKVKEERVGVEANNDTLTLEAAVPASDPDVRAFIQRQYVTALLWEKFFANTKSFDQKTNLAVVPLWLVEGLTEWLREEPGKDREAIVKRAATIHRAPTLDQVTGWKEISQDRLMSLYQRAFCYYLVNSLIHGDKRANFQQWLATFAGANQLPAKYLFPTEEGWQQQLLQAPARSHDIVFTWDESSAALADADTIVVPGKKRDDTRFCTLDTVINFPVNADVKAALQKKIFDLTALELRAHPSWREIFALYRFGLTALVDGKKEGAAQYFEEAERRRSAEISYHQKLGDYINWVEVTKNYNGEVSHFQSYFETAHAMDEMQANPDKPNPIRADLIHVEDKL